MNYNHINTILAAIEEGKEVETRSNDMAPWSEPRHSQHLCESIGTLNNPSYWRIKPTPRKVPLTTSDIKPGMVFRWKCLPGTVRQWTLADPEKGILLGSGALVTWKELCPYWEWSLDGETWNELQDGRASK